MSNKIQLQLLFTPNDESKLSKKLRSVFPDVNFLDDKVWDTSPILRSSIPECTSFRCYLYNGKMEDLPTVIDSRGRLEGPGAGVVIQVLRPRLSDGVLRSGSIGTGYNATDKTMEDFVRGVWRILKTIGAVGVIRPDGRIDLHYMVGQDARDEWRKGNLRLRDRSVEIYYAPKE